jgi:hypothetical protein
MLVRVLMLKIFSRLETNFTNSTPEFFFKSENVFNYFVFSLMNFWVRET